MSFTSEQIEAGQAIYSGNVLRIYDIVVHRLANALVWRVPTGRLDRLYRTHLSANHLEAGVGTGFFLDREAVPGKIRRLVLMDLNPDALAFSLRRLRRFAPTGHIRNLLAPIPFQGERFDSVALNYVLHCLPGRIDEKAVVFDHLKALMNPGARLFGSTLLEGGVRRRLADRALSGVYNRRGVFSNLEDDLDGLRSALERRFDEVSIEIAGRAAIFSARA